MPEPGRLCSCLKTVSQGRWSHCNSRHLPHLCSQHTAVWDLRAVKKKIGRGSKLGSKMWICSMRKNRTGFRLKKRKTYHKKKRNWERKKGNYKSGRENIQTHTAGIQLHLYKMGVHCSECLCRQGKDNLHCKRDSDSVPHRGKLNWKG